jgi:hypothetical protein
VKGICFTFDAFGQWSEHDRSKMKWRMKVGIEWRPSMADRPKNVSYPVFIPKPSTHHMHDQGSIVPHIWPKVFTDNQMSRIKYNYYINSVSKDYDDSQGTEQQKTP